MVKLRLGKITLPEHSAYPAAEQATTVLRDAVRDKLLFVSLLASITFGSIGAMVSVAGAWILLAALWGYQARLDIALTRAVRRWQFFRAGLTTAGALAAWALPIYCVVATWNFLNGDSRIKTANSWGSVIGGTLLAFAMAILLAEQTWLLWRVTWRERCGREAAWRCLLLGLLLILGIVLRAFAYKVFYPEKQ